MATGITNTITSGIDTGLSTKLNDNYAECYPDIQIYTGSDFNASRTSTGTTTNSHVLSIGAGVIKRYVKMTFNVDTQFDTLGAGTTNVSISAGLEVETSEAGAGSYTTRYGKTLSAASGSNHEGSHDATRCVVVYYEPTAGEMTNGLDIRITGTAVVNEGSASGTSDITNVQTVLEWV